MNTPILQTKLYLPQPQPDLVPRGRLIDVLDDGLARPLTLVCAPAGYGKTTLVTAWLARVERRVAWLSLDELDNEPGRYLAYVVAAIRSVCPTFGDATNALLNSAQLQPPDAIVATFVNELAALADPLILVLDDFHVLTDSVIHSGLERMLPYLPPHFHLVITSRGEPQINLARLRVRNQVNEVGVQALRFTPDEAVDFVNQRMGLTLSQEDVMELEARTEGWAAGLQLAALTLQNSPRNGSISSLIRALSGSDRHLTDYLTHEIVLTQPDDVQQFLLVTSGLKRMCAELCNALTGRPDGQQILEDLERRNLFLIPLDSERRWYRYHHLFGDLLQQIVRQQQSDSVAVAHHLTASIWFEQNEYIEEAIEYAIQAGELDRAAQLLNVVVSDLLLRQGAFVQVRRWLEKVPFEQIEAYPMVLVAGMFSNLIAYDLVAAEPYFEALRKADDLPDTAKGLLGAAEANLMRARGDHEEGKEHLRETMQSIGEDELTANALIRMQMAAALMEEEDMRGAYRLWAESRDLAALSQDTFSQLMAMRWMGGTLDGCGELRRAKQELDAALSVATTHGGTPLPIAGDIHIGLSNLFYEWNQLEQAQEHCAVGSKLVKQSGSGDAQANAYIRQIDIALARNQPEQANQILRELKQLSQQLSALHEVKLEWDFYPFFEALVFLRQGELKRAAEWIQETPVDLTEMPTKVDGYHNIHLQYRLTKAWIEQDPAGLESLDPLFVHLIALAEEREIHASGIWLRCLYASTLLLRQETDLALEHFAAALQAGEPEGYIRTFVDQGEPVRALLLLAQERAIQAEYVATLLAAFDDPQAAEAKVRVEASPLVDPLTGREEEILALVAAGLTNQEIAEKLIISIGTVKRHVSNIFGKLGASHRAQAVALANEMGLL